MLILPSHSKPITGLRLNPPIGLDFGTSNSVISSFADELHRRGSFVYSLPVTGSFMYPSLVYHESKSGILKGGVLAYNRRNLEPENIIHSIKRRILEEEVEVGGRNFDVKRIISEILIGLLREVKSTELEMLPQMVTLTVPYYFKQLQNQIIKEAANIAFKEVFGLIPKIELLPEPVAAAIYVLFQNKSLNISERTLLVYDIGGGTCDLTLVRFSINRVNVEFEVLANDGVSDLGGDDIDNLLCEYVIQSEGIDYHALSKCDQKRLRGLLLNEVEKAKKILSSSDIASVIVTNLPSSAGRTFIDTEISRDTLESLMSMGNNSIIGRIQCCLDRLISKAGTHAVNIDTIVPVGGTSRIPLIQRLFKDSFSCAEILESDDEDIFLNVSKGAAIYSALLVEGINPFGPSIKAFSVVTRVPHAIGVEKYNHQIEQMIKENSVTPSIGRQVYYPTRYNEDCSLVLLDKLSIYQGNGTHTNDSDILHVGDVDLSKYSIYAHGRSLEKIPIELELEADSTTVKVNGCIRNSQLDGSDIIFNETLKMS